jgi:hypothetical protein
MDAQTVGRTRHPMLVRRQHRFTQNIIQHHSR